MFIIVIDLEWSVLIIASDSTILDGSITPLNCRIIYAFQIQSGLCSVFSSAAIAVTLYFTTIFGVKYLGLKSIFCILLLSLVFSLTYFTPIF